MQNDIELELSDDDFNWRSNWLQILNLLQDFLIFF